MKQIKLFAIVFVLISIGVDGFTQERYNPKEFLLNQKSYNNYFENNSSSLRNIKYVTKRNGVLNNDYSIYNTTDFGGPNGDEQNLKITMGMMIACIGVISNEIYAYNLFSLYNKNKYFEEIVNANNWSIGLRKTFKHSVLEYGVINYFHQTDFTYNGDPINRNEWAFHFSYMHNVFYNKTPDWLKLYVGLTYNSIIDDGYGVVLGSEFKIIDRLNLNFKYEFTNMMHDIQLGLIFRYQKKYLWQ